MPTRPNFYTIKMANQHPYLVEPLSAEEVAAQKRIHTKDNKEYVRVEGYILPEQFLTIAEDDVRTVPLRNNDVFVVSIPRSGTTWTQELVWLLSNNLDFDTAKAKPLVERFPFLEYHMFHLDRPKLTSENEDMNKKMEQALTPAVQLLAQVPKGEPRFIKSHLPLCLLPEGALDTAKVVYVARDPRDIAVSVYHFLGANKRTGIVCDFKTYYYEIISKDLLLWGPIFKHAKEAWANRNHPNLLFIFYEELSKDLIGTVKRVAKFLGTEYTDEQYDKLCDHLKFDNFKNNKAVDQQDLVQHAKDKKTNFIRKGVAGGWRDHFDAEMSAHAQRWIEHNLRDTDLRFPQL